MVRNNTYREFFDEQRKWDAAIQEKRRDKEFQTKEDIDAFAVENADIANKIAMSMERAMLRTRSQRLMEKPAENVAKSIELMMDVDTRYFDRLGTDEKESLKSELSELIRIAETFKGLL